MSDNDLKKRLRSVLQASFGLRLKGIVLYGSESRGEAGPDSDIDLLVLLDGPPREPEDSWQCINSLYPLVLELGRPIHAEPVDATEYNAGDYPLYQSAARDGVLI